MKRFFGVVTRPQTYRNLAYLLLALPLGTVWFTVLVTGVSVGTSLLVLALLGIPLLLAMWYVVRAFANAERAVANGLLGTQIGLAPMAGGVSGNLWVRLRATSSERARWRELGFLLLRFPAGIATFTAAVTALTVPLAVAYAPIAARYVDEGDRTYGAESPWAWLLIPAGVLGLFLALHLMNALARACARWATAAL